MAAVQARERPTDLCLGFMDEERCPQYLTFTDVWDLARGVAALLRDAAEGVVGRPVPADAASLVVPVLVVAIDDGPYLPIAELGGFLANCCLTPVDPHDPVARVAGMLEEIPTLAVVVTKDWGDYKKLSEVVDALRCTHPALPVFDLSVELPLRPSLLLPSGALRSPGPSHALPAEDEGASDPESVAYLWYTSGSTGKPKGCLIPHRAFSNWCAVKNAGHGIDASAVVLVASASTFDPSIGDIFASWAIGARVVVASRMLLFAHLGWVIQRLQVTHLTCTPSLWGSFEGAYPEHPDIASLRVICLGGERMSSQLLRSWATDSGGADLLNTYGTTECTVWQTLRSLRPGDSVGRVGFCLPGNEVRVVDKDSLRQLDTGETGEVLQGGVQVGLGYFRRPERSSTAFLRDPSPGLEGIWYRTGDGGRWDPEHGLEIAGRFDAQVKVRGMRVELGDIEQAVVQAGERHLCSACCACLREGALHAFVQLVTVTADTILGDLDIGEHGIVTEFLLQGAALLLPRHMLPTRFLLMRRLPLTRSGKVDRGSLPETDAAVRLDRCSDHSGLTKLERAVASAWGEVLGIDGSQLRAQDHFLALGGNSVSILRVSRLLTAEARARGAVVDPDGPVAFALAPERLIHLPRLQQYCSVIEKSGIAHYLLDLPTGGDAMGPISEATTSVSDGGDGGSVLGYPDGGPAAEEEVEAAMGLRINYTKLLVTERRSQSRDAMQQEALQRKELDHDAWEQVPRASPVEMLFKAAAAGIPGIVATLLDTGAVEVDGEVPASVTPLKGAAATGLLPHQRLGLTPLHLAVAEGHEAVIRILLAQRADPGRADYRGCPPLHKAAERGSRTVVEELLGARASLWEVDRARRFTALHAAAKAGNLSTIESLLEASLGERSDRNAKGFASILCEEAVGGAEGVDGPVYVNLLDRWNRTALHWTVLNAHPCCAERLVSAGATIEGTAVQCGRHLLFAPQKKDGPAAAATGRAKRARKVSLEDPWALALERFGEDGGHFREILRDRLP